MNLILFSRPTRFAARDNGSTPMHILFLAALGLLCFAPGARADNPDAIKPVGDPVRHPDGTQRVSVSPDGKSVYVVGFKNKARVWDIATQSKIIDFEVENLTVSWAWLGWDGKGLFSETPVNGKKSNYRMWDLTKGEPISPLLDKKFSIRDVSPDGQIALGDDCNNGVLWDISSGNLLGDPKDPDLKGITTGVFGPDSRILCTQNKSGTVSLWEAAAGKRIADIADGKDFSSTRLGVFSPDGQTVALKGTHVSNTIIGARIVRSSVVETQFFHAATGKPKGKAIPDDRPAKLVLPKHHEFVFPFSPDGKRLLDQRWGKDGCELVLYDVESGKPDQRFHCEAGAPSAARQDTLKWVWSAAFTPNGRTLIAVCEFRAEIDRKKLASEDDKVSAVFVWDVDSGKQIGEPLWFCNWVKEIVANPDNKTFWTVTGDDPLRGIGYTIPKRVEAQQWQLPERWKDK
jgi:WD40 repeat protein